LKESGAIQRGRRRRRSNTDVAASRQYDRFHNLNNRQLLTINNSLREADRHVSLPDSFIFRKNTSNKHNFIKIRGEAGILNNCHNFY